MNFDTRPILQHFALCAVSQSLSRKITKMVLRVTLRQQKSLNTPLGPYIKCLNSLYDIIRSFPAVLKLGRQPCLWSGTVVPHKFTWAKWGPAFRFMVMRFLLSFTSNINVFPHPFVYKIHMFLLFLHKFCWIVFWWLSIHQVYGQPDWTTKHKLIWWELCTQEGVPLYLTTWEHRHCTYA